jgi:transcriptional regulator with XRE-family HTH domain
LNGIVIGHRLKALREEKGVSIYEVADYCGISAAAICMYENGKRIPKDSIKMKLAS